MRESLLLSFVTSVLAITQLLVPACARVTQKHVSQVPIERLLSNLQQQESKASTDQERAQFEFKIGRLYSMAFARNTSEVPFDNYDLQKNIQTVTPAYSTNPLDLWPPHRQFESNHKADTAAEERLQLAIEHLRKAVSLDTNSNDARLGLAWCLDQAGEKTEAKSLYRTLIRTGQEPIRQEVAQYLIPLLDPVREGREISTLRRIPAPVYHRTSRSPIVVPLSPNVTPQELMQDTRVAFDVAGIGKRTYSPWPSASAGWLVYDPDKSGKISSGLQLFGDCTFWIFWQNGYDALAALDDNQDGLLSGNELVGLAVWQDSNFNGVSEAGEVHPLSDFGITDFSYQCQRDKHGMYFSERGVRFSSGQWSTTYDWMLKEHKR